MTLYEFEGRRPRVGKTSYIHETAVVIGDVRIGDTCFVGAGAVLRGDWGTVIVGDGSNIQENAVLHAGPESTTHLGPNSHIGHGAILHGCTLDEHVLVGMGAIINDASHIGANSVIASGALVAPRTQVPGGKLVVGVPARVVRDTGEQMEQFAWLGTRLYQTLPERYAKSLKQVDIEECRPEGQAPDSTA
jgi:carbonic anhydrase/acetyltransferase-like protein (isoleucine patch superfamily)